VIWHLIFQGFVRDNLSLTRHIMFTLLIVVLVLVRDS
jgi:hypothetical protein